MREPSEVGGEHKRPEKATVGFHCQKLRPNDAPSYQAVSGLSQVDSDNSARYPQSGSNSTFRNSYKLLLLSTAIMIFSNINKI
jgi:hypothetical protein